MLEGVVDDADEANAERDRWIPALVDHPVESAAMGRSGRSRVLEKFTWPQVVERCLNAYESALRRPLQSLAVNGEPTN